jgi:putative tryptophan/tyrosine transport system substrate-binding protein
MKRREFIAGLGGVTAWPVAARAQQVPMPVIGILNAGSPDPSRNLMPAFLKGLGQAGYVEGRNVAIEYRYADNQTARLPELAAELVRRRVAVIITQGSHYSALAAKAATTTIPIVFTTGVDPVQQGIVSSLNRPGGNVTGVVFMNLPAISKRLGILHQMVPGATRFALLVNSASPYEAEVADARTAASAIGGQLEVLTAATTRDIDTSFASLAQSGAQAVIVNNAILFANRRVQIVILAARHGVPAIYFDRSYPEAGGLMSYGSNIADQYREAGAYVGRILNREMPADLPVLLPTKFEFVLNLQTANTFGIDVPQGLLAIADEVIQ